MVKIYIPGQDLLNIFIGPISRKRQSINLRRSIVLRLTRLKTSDTLNTFSD